MEQASICFRFLRQHAGIGAMLLLFAGLMYAWITLLTMP